MTGAGPVTGARPADLEYLRSTVRDLSAIVVDEGKDYLLDAKLGRVAQDVGAGSIAGLVQRLRAGDVELRQRVAEAMTTNETHFFRDLHPFEALRDEVIPALLRSGAGVGSGVSIWSAAASTGQEAYSVAMVLREGFPELGRSRILGTDLSAAVLERAAAGVYSQLEVNRGLPAAMLVRWFEREGRAWRIDESIRRSVRFMQLNLARPLPALPPMDVVLLRNVLLYFDRPSREAVLHRVASVLRPGGYLLLGGAENLLGLDTPFVPAPAGRTLCYRTPGWRDA